MFTKRKKANEILGQKIHENSGKYFFELFFLLRVAEWMVDLKNRGTPEDKAPQFITTSFRKEMVEAEDGFHSGWRQMAGSLLEQRKH